MQGLELRARSRLFIGRTLTATRMLGIEPASARPANSLTVRPRALGRATIVTSVKSWHNDVPQMYRTHNPPCRV